MGLFQIGGIGYMTLTTYYLLFTTKKITLWHNKIIGAEFTLPKSIKIKDFIKSVIVFTTLMETLGAEKYFIYHKNYHLRLYPTFDFRHNTGIFC